MKSAVFYGPHDIRVEDVPVPKTGSDEVLIRVKACGVCGTDIHIFEGDKGAADTFPPCILGHEFSGVIEKTGSGVVNCKVGDRVCADPNDACGKCDPCREGLAHYCEHMTGYGTGTNGGFAQYCKVRAKQVYHVADNITFDEAAMSEPVSCCLHGIDMSDIYPGAAVLILGGGMIGQLMMQLARGAGAGTVIMSEPVGEKREMALRLGADIVVDPANEDVAGVLRAHGIRRVSTVIECCGLKSTIAQALELVGDKGTVMIFGLTKPDDAVEIKPFSLFQKETTVRASYINPYTMGRAVTLINAKRINVSSMVADRIALEKLPAVLSDPELRRKGKYIVHPWD